MKTSICSMCGHKLPSEEVYVFDEEEMCLDCLEEHTVLCYECGERIWCEDNQGSEEHPLCRRCYDEDYTNCMRCGALLRWSDAYYRDRDEEHDHPYCDSCYYNLPKDYIQNYYYKPQPIFYGEGPRYFGVELEMDEGGESEEHAEQLLEIANRCGEEYVYCKHDGSLNDGFEIVTHPMTLEYHMQKMPWTDILHEAVRMGYRSHQAGTCGLHIHVSRRAFGSTEAEQDAVIARILYFVEKHWEEILKFTRRTQRQMDQWAARYGYQERPQDILDHAKKGNGQGRYVCVNLHNYHTVEFRMFRGTLKCNTLLATLQFVDRLCDLALHLSDEEIKALSWPQFAVECTAPELVQYLKERRLYVNDVVESEEEV